MSDHRPPPESRPEFGPSGYLPERASKRARKIVLRAPLGLQWLIAALVAGVAVLIAGVLYLQRSDAPPPEPWIAVAVVDGIGASEPLAEHGVLLVRTGGRIRAFADALDVAYCEPSNRLEASDGRIWNLTGRGLAGTPSLSERPILVQDDVVYLDPTRSAPGPEPSEDAAESGCP